VKLEAKDKSAICPRCGCESHKLHQNHDHLAQDLDWNGKAVDLRINSRQFKWDNFSNISINAGKEAEVNLENEPALVRKHRLRLH